MNPFQPIPDVTPATTEAVFFDFSGFRQFLYADDHPPGSMSRPNRIPNADESHAMYGQCVEPKIGDPDVVAQRVTVLDGEESQTIQEFIDGAGSVFAGDNITLYVQTDSGKLRVSRKFTRGV